MFKTQKPYEKIEAVIRRHRVVLLFHYFYFAVLIAFGYGVYYAFVHFLSFGSEGFSEFVWFLFIIYILILWQSFFRILMDYYLDTWILTDHRIVAIHQKGLFKRETAELRYSKIQDISVKVDGFWATMLNYGDVHVQTAGAVPEFKFEQIPRPNQIKDKILQITDEYMKMHPNDTEIHEIENQQQQ